MVFGIVEYAAVLGTLVLMEGLLAADNALVLAVLVSRLPRRDQQRKALLYGIVGAFVFRSIAVVAATRRDGRAAYRGSGRRSLWWS